MKRWYQQTDIMLGIGVVGVVAMMIIPIPAFLLDMLMGVSVMIGLIVLLSAMYSRQTSDFSVFPTVLLVSTVYRLALNVSSTRLILLDGPGFDGKLIRAFGEFVVGGNYLIGIIIFIVLVLVQMMVITKGATRIGEVAARFTLDALPGKQMSIDTDLSAGIITEEEARDAREKLRKEVDFYGQMDGATKFVQGDVRVGLVITAINIVGGIIVGVVMHNQGMNDVLQTYTLLTIGDGLVAQIPSLLITTATGMVVTRAGSTDDLSSDIGNQLFRNARILWMVTGTLIFVSVLPGFPKLSLWFVAAFLGFLAFSITRREQSSQKEETQKRKTEEASSSSPERFLDEMSIDPLKLEVGFNLVPLVDASQGGTLLERITSLRKQFAHDMGMIVPPVRITDNMDIEGNEYVILVGGIEVARSKVFPDRLAALDGGNISEPMTGDAYTDPTFHLSGVLVAPEDRKEAEGRGYLVVDASNVIITHLSDTIRTFATQVMGREEIKLLMDKLKGKFPTVIDEVTKELPSGALQSVLHNLLKERVSIRNMVTILETLADNAGRTKDPILLTEYVRVKLGRQIASQYWDKGTLQVIQVDPSIENMLRESQTYDEREGRITALNPHALVALRDSFVRSYNEVQQQGAFPLFLTGSAVRMDVFMILERELSARNFAVLAYEELPQETKIKVVSQVVVNEEVSE